MKGHIDMKGVEMKESKDSGFCTIKNVDAKRFMVSQPWIKNASYSEHIGKIPTKPR
jgi:hypothetical protein